MVIEAALHGDGLCDVDPAGAGVSVEIETGAADGEPDGTAAGADAPVGGGLAFGFYVARTSAGFERAGDTTETKTAAAGFGLDVAGTGLLEVDIAGARSKGGGPVDAANLDGA